MTIWRTWSSARKRLQQDNYSANNFRILQLPVPRSCSHTNSRKLIYKSVMLVSRTQGLGVAQKHAYFHGQRTLYFMTWHAAGWDLMGRFCICSNSLLSSLFFVFCMCFGFPSPLALSSLPTPSISIRYRGIELEALLDLKPVDLTKLFCAR